MAFKNNKVERVRSLRRQISAEIRKAKTCFYENKGKYIYYAEGDEDIKGGAPKYFPALKGGGL